MRQIVLDTETTGLEPASGHRIIEIGAVEMLNRRRTERNFHQYLNPERDIEDGAYDVHGLSTEFLSGKPLFRDIARDFLDFVKDSELIIHNAPFDVAFLNAELRRLGPEWGRIEDYCGITDTLKLARELHPGQKNSLDALCARYKVDNSNRDLHGALLDAGILLDVYLAMTGGQASLSLGGDSHKTDDTGSSARSINADRPRLRVIEPNAQEQRLHEQRLRDIDRDSQGKCIWLKSSD